MVSEKYACAYKEVIEILKYTNKDDVIKIPIEKIELWKNNMKEDHDFVIDEEKTLSEQNISKEARAILANIFKDYWATDYQKERIEAKEKYDLNQIEKEKQEKYNPDNIFAKKHENIIETENNQAQLVEHKESVFRKLLNKIKVFFKK